MKGLSGRRLAWAAVAVAAQALAATSGVTIKTVSYRGDEVADDTRVRLSWEGTLTNEGVDPVRAWAVLTLKDAAGAKIYTCESDPLEMGRLETKPHSALCPVAGEVWKKAHALQVTTRFEIVASRAPEPSAPEPLTKPAPLGTVDAPAPSSAQREVEEAQERLRDAEEDERRIQREYSEKYNDFLDACSARRSVQADASKCARLQEQLEKIRNKLGRAQEKRERAQDSYARAVRQLQETMQKNRR